MNSKPDSAPWPFRNVASLAAASTLAVLLSACSTPTQTRYYTIDAATPGDRAVGNYRGPALQVRGMRIPASMDRAELVNERVGGAVQLREFDRWAAPLERSARQALTQNLATRLPQGAVVFGGAIPPVDRIDLNVEVLALRIADGSASMWVAWGMQRQSTAGAVPGGPAAASRELRLRVPAGDDAGATATAWSALLGQLADRITAELAAAP